MAKTFEELFEGLNESITKAKAEDDSGSEENDEENAANKDESNDEDGGDDSELVKSVATLTEGVAELKKFLTDEDKGLAGLLKGISARQEASVEAISKVADRVEALEGRGAVRKSVSADDSDTETEDDNRSEEELIKAGTNELYKSLDRIGAEAFQGGRGLVILT